MADEVRYKQVDGIAVLSLEGAAGNALSAELRRALSEALERAMADPAIRGIVLHGGAAGFSAGIDLAEHGRPVTAPTPAAPTPTPAALCTRIENSPKPVVAALHGHAIGAGAALALAAHARVADADTRLAFPDMRAGLLPGGGATQRLPRLLGAQIALQMLSGTQSMTAGDAALAPLFASVTRGDPVEAAVVLAGRLADAGRWPRTCEQTVGLADPQAYLAAVGRARAALADPAGIEAAVVQCVEAALLFPFERALELEQCLFDEHLHSDLARGARHLILAERATARLPGIAAAPVGELADMVLTGRAGPFADLAVMGLDAGWRVHLDPVDPNQEVRLRALIVQFYDAALQGGRLHPTLHAARLARLAPPQETRPGNALWLDLGGARPPPGALHVALMQDEVAPEGAASVWLRLAPPIHGATLAELAWEAAADPGQLASLARALARTGKSVIRSAPVAGMVAGNLEAALWRAALALLGAGQTPGAVDAAADALGFAAGPFRRMDDWGLGQVVARLETLARARGRVRPPDPALQRLVASGRTGRAAGRGFFRYDGAQILPDPDVPRAAAAPLPRALLATALHAALANQAARLLHDGEGFRASDLDVVAVRAMGFRRARGGVLFQADLRGIFSLGQAMRRFAALDADLWTPHERIEEMIRNGDGFFGRAV